MATTNNETSGAELSSGKCQVAEDQVDLKPTESLRVDDGESDKSAENVHSTLSQPENGAISSEIEAFELGIEDSKDLLSLNEELSNILDPKVGLVTRFDPIGHTPLQCGGVACKSL